MTLRKHKNTRTFRIVSSRRYAPKNRILDLTFADGNSAGEVRNGFLFGRDRGNTVIHSILPA